VNICMKTMTRDGLKDKNIASFLPTKIISKNKE
jgi:hypothetical protein